MGFLSARTPAAPSNVIEAADEIRKGAAGMRQADIELGKRSSRPPKIKLACGDRRSNDSQKIMQMVVREPLGADHVERMEKDRDSQGVNTLEDWQERRVG